MEKLAAKAEHVAAQALLARVSAELQSEIGDLARGLRNLVLGAEKAAVIARLESLDERTQIVLPDETDDKEAERRALVFECVKLCREPGRVAALLDRADYWLHESREVPGLWKQLARIGGPALNDAAFPASAVVAGGCLVTLLTGKGETSDVDVFVASEEEAESVRELLRHWDYKLAVKSPNLTRAWYTIAGSRSLGSGQQNKRLCVKQQLDLVVMPQARDPARLVRTFDAACCEAWCTRERDTVVLTASAAHSWSSMTLPEGRAGPLASLRVHKMHDLKGFKYTEPVPDPNRVPVYMAPVPHAMDQFFTPKGQPTPYGNFLRRNLVFPWSDPVDPDTKQWALLTDWTNMVTSDDGRTLVLRPRPNQEAALAKHGIRSDLISPRSMADMALLAGSCHVRLLLARDRDQISGQELWVSLHHFVRPGLALVEDFS